MQQNQRYYFFSPCIILPGAYITYNANRIATVGCRLRCVMWVIANVAWSLLSQAEQATGPIISLLSNSTTHISDITWGYYVPLLTSSWDTKNTTCSHICCSTPQQLTMMPGIGGIPLKGHNKTKWNESGGSIKTQNPNIGNENTPELRAGGYGPKIKSLYFQAEWWTGLNVQL